MSNEKRGAILLNRTNIDVGYVAPNAQSKTKVTEGLYSLNRRSNVPYVSFIGSQGYRKIITWGEIAEVPKGQTVTIGNASYHGGDIFINKGPDENNRPSRITVPVPFVFENYTIPGEGQQGTYWRAQYPCDTRAAKRAYLMVDAYVLQNVTLSLFIRNRQLDGSFNTQSSLQGFRRPWGPGVGTLNAIQYTAGNVLNYIPLGVNAPPSDDTRPHTLLSAADVFVLFGDEDLGDFVNWPADAQIFNQQIGANGEWTQQEVPTTLYVIEYD